MSPNNYKKNCGLGIKENLNNGGCLRAYATKNKHLYKKKTKKKNLIKNQNKNMNPT